jgi:hypothetical protein
MRPNQYAPRTGQRTDERQCHPYGREAGPEDRDEGSNQVGIRSAEVLTVGIHQHELPMKDVERAQPERRLACAQRCPHAEDQSHHELERYGAE